MQKVIINATRVLLNQHMDLCNTKLISSCLEQIPTLRMVKPTSTRTPEEVDKVKEALEDNAAAIPMAITETQNRMCCGCQTLKNIVLKPTQFYVKNYKCSQDKSPTVT